MPANPFPECECEAEAIVNIGWMFATIGLVLLLMVVMLYLYVKMREFLPILLVFLFSLIIGVQSFSVSRIPFTPSFQIFFIMFQGIIFLMTSMDLIEYKKRGEKIND